MSGIMLWTYDLPPVGKGRRWLECHLDDDGEPGPDGRAVSTLEVRAVCDWEDGSEEYTIVHIPHAAIPSFLAALGRIPATDKDWEDA